MSKKEDKNTLYEIFMRHPVTGNRMYFDGDLVNNEDGTYTIIVNNGKGERIQHTIKTEEL